MSAINRHLEQFGKTTQDLNVHWSDPAHPHVQKTKSRYRSDCIHQIGEGTVLVLLFWLFGLIQLQDVCSMCSPEPIILTYRGGQC